MPKYITQEMFNVCVITAAKYAHGNSKNYHEAGQLVAESYEREYADENLASYIALAAEQTVKHITEKLPPKNLVATCYQLQFCVKEFLDSTAKCNLTHREMKVSYDSRGTTFILGGIEKHSWLFIRSSPVSNDTRYTHC